MQVREQHQDERGERDEVDQDVCERRDEENELGRDGGDENECVQGCAHLDVHSWRGDTPNKLLSPRDR